MNPDDLFDSYEDDPNEDIALGLAIPDDYKCRSHPTLSADQRDLRTRIRERRNRLKGATE